MVVIGDEQTHYHHMAVIGDKQTKISLSQIFYKSSKHLTPTSHLELRHQRGRTYFRMETHYHDKLLKHIYHDMVVIGMNKHFNWHVAPQNDCIGEESN